MASLNLLSTGLVQDPGAVPLVVAITGHRDPRPQDLPLLRERFCALIKALFAALPHTPLILLSGMAVGMDTEAAELFGELADAQHQRHPDGPRHQLVAALPKPRELYRQDDFLDNSNERLRLDRLLQRCDAVLDAGNCPELAVPQANLGTSDSLCYGLQGIFLVRHCYLLVAFSNGMDSGKVGGTSQTVAIQRGYVYPLFLQVDEVIAAREPGVVVEITTPRLSDPELLCPVAHVRYWGESPDGSITGSSELTNSERQTLPSLLCAKGSIPAQIEMINSRLRDWPPQSAHGAGVHGSLWLYSDFRANAGKTAYLRLCRLVMGFSVVMSLSTAEQEWQAAGLIVVLAAVLIFPKLQSGPKLDFIQWRCLAESLLVTDFWSAAGVAADAADLFHSQTSQNFRWIRTVLRARRLQLLTQRVDPARHAPFPQVIGCFHQWIISQEEWLSRAIARQQRWDNRYILIGALSFFFALFLAIGYWMGGAGLIHPLWPELLLGISVASFGYRELMGYSDTNARYGRSRTQFSRAHEALSVVRDEPSAPGMLMVRQQLVVEAVGREKIDELNDWIGDQLQRVYAPGQ